MTCIFREISDKNRAKPGHLSLSVDTFSPYQFEVLISAGGSGMRAGWTLGVGVILVFALVTNPGVVFMVLALAMVVGWQLRKRGGVR
ncbi:hypothetical protein [Nocardia flavorosea]|uniref:Uncharacterized protein n=1 Tax=Nocardia flavorosea TaxID=53429 RepID=A0A846YTR7_9NOCA|nr:hypothetical protein [Nocardia flavorosea]NKY60940.1 hypothetical protein [Nocardia flavorosea]